MLCIAALNRDCEGADRLWDFATVEADGDRLSVGTKICVTGKNLPTTRNCHATDQEIDSRSTNARSFSNCARRADA